MTKVKVDLTSQQIANQKRIADAGIGANCVFVYCGKSKPKNGEPARTAKPRDGVVFEVSDEYFKMADPEHLDANYKPIDYSSVRTYRFDTMPNLVSIK